ncbi:DinB family protein [Dyella tabacisoli]|uniref:DUF664 domain-containing protein n=1 Tax=Dyella tabacisoli TaxID=2282381 RepID=A0A369UKN9_9GAMM|nr:DinB family protein [Dyella tabacisoli]RDD81067.1 DUF664 domain-containing protein [Dyella tabacisoli]
MNRTDQIRLMAKYNAWMNSKLYDAAMTLPDEALSADKKAFFGSILGTLNHLVVADRIWLRRFAAHTENYAALQPIRELPALTSLEPLPFADIRSLAEHRQLLDQAITAWAQSVHDGELDAVLAYSNTKGIASKRNFFGLILHFFNHQTHHRGQVTTLLSQAGVDVGATDLLVLIPEA